MPTSVENAVFTPWRPFPVFPGRHSQALRFAPQASLNLMLRGPDLILGLEYFGGRDWLP
jgi:hypothetical protein